MSVKYFDKNKKKWVIFPGIGVPGKDAYEVAVENGYNGTVEEYNQYCSNFVNYMKKLDNIDSYPVENSENLILSKGVYAVISTIKNDYNELNTIVDEISTRTQPDNIITTDELENFNKEIEDTYCKKDEFYSKDEVNELINSKYTLEVDDPLKFENNKLSIDLSNNVALSDFDSFKTNINEAINLKQDRINASLPLNISGNTISIDLTNYVTKGDFNDTLKNYITTNELNLDKYVDNTELTNAIKDFVKSSELEKYVTRVDLDGKSYLTKDDLDNYYKKEEVYNRQEVNDLIPEIPEIPTKISQLENDSKYITEGDVDLSDYVQKGDIGLKEATTVGAPGYSSITSNTTINLSNLGYNQENSYGIIIANNNSVVSFSGNNVYKQIDEEGIPNGSIKIYSIIYINNNFYVNLGVYNL